MKETLSLLTVLAVLSISLPAQGQPWLGSGTEGDPYLIEDANNMQAIGADPNYWDAHFEMVNDINLAQFTGTEFNIIGNWGSRFSGVLDGNYHLISNFNFNSTGIHSLGVFGVVDGENAEIRNLGLIDPNIDAGTADWIGPLAGQVVNGTITNCYAMGGSVSGNHVGTSGLVGKNNGMLRHCYSDVTVLGQEIATGGLVGWNTEDGTISNSYAIGNVSGADWVGGLVGFNEGGMIANSYSSATVFDSDNCIGGLVGWNDEGTISDSYAIGSVVGEGPYVGGLVGMNFSSTISNCYSVGTVEGDADGGLVGYKIGGTVEYSFWDVNNSGQLSSDGGTGLTSAEMQMESTFTDAGWDFVGEVINGPNDIWRMCVDDVNYPLLSWQFNEVDFICPDGVDLLDFSVLGLAWGSEQGDGNWNKACDISDPNDDMINMKDLDAFTNNWLAGVE